MVQLNTLFPIPNPVIVVTGEVGVVIDPLPETRVQSPLPEVAVLAAIVTLELVEQIV